MILGRPTIGERYSKSPDARRNRRRIRCRLRSSRSWRGSAENTSALSAIVARSANARPVALTSATVLLVGLGSLAMVLRRPRRRGSG